MKGISSNTLKLDGNMSYENSQKIKEFTAGFNKGDQIKIDRETSTTFKDGKFEETSSIIFTRNNNQLLEKLTHSFKKLKNNIVENKTQFKKPDLIDNIFKQPSISVKRINILADKKINETELNAKISMNKNREESRIIYAKSMKENNSTTIYEKNSIEIVKAREGDNQQEIHGSNQKSFNTSLENKQQINKNNTDALWKIIKDDIGL